jgi:hypothetical protein
MPALPNVSSVLPRCGESRKTTYGKCVAGKMDINNLRVGAMAAKIAPFLAAV